MINIDELRIPEDLDFAIVLRKEPEPIVFILQTEPGSRVHISMKRKIDRMMLKATFVNMTLLVQKQIDEMHKELRPKLEAELAKPGRLS